MNASARYVGTTETAKIIRAILKKEHPEHKFSVRSSQYSGGSSIRIVVPKGQTELKKTVDARTAAFAGRGFDGMIDMAYSKDSWFNAKTMDVQPARSGGTEGSRGLCPAYDKPAPGPDYELIHFCSSHIFVEEEWRD